MLDRIDSVTAAAPALVFALHRHEGHFMIGVAILGSTGSVGEHTLDVIARHPDRFRVVALGAHRNVEKLADQCRRFSVPYAALADGAAAARLRERIARAAGADASASAAPIRWSKLRACPKCTA